MERQRLVYNNQKSFDRIVAESPLFQRRVVIFSSFLLVRSKDKNHDTSLTNEIKK